MYDIQRCGRAESAALLAPFVEHDMTHGRFGEMRDLGWRIKSTKLSATFDWPHFIVQYGSTSVLLFGIEEKGLLKVASTKRELEPKPGWQVIVLVPPVKAEESAEE